MSPAVSRVLEALGDRLTGTVRPDGARLARCPAHDDRRASLSVGEGQDGRALLFCHAGCEVAEVVRAMGLKVNDLMPPRAASPPGPASPPARIVAIYDYCGEMRELLYQVVRFEPKSFRQRRPAGNGWTWSLGGVRRVLYKLPELLAAAPETPVFVVEGEKDADALTRLGLLATTNAAGAGKWCHEYSEALAGRHVVILPDNDDPGRRHATDVARAVASVAASVKVIELPGLPDKGDVSDWLAKGGTTAALLTIVGTVPFFGQSEPAVQREPSPEAPRIAPVVALPSAAWSEPRPLPEQVAAVPTFDDRLLPDALRPWLSDVAERTQCPPEYPAVGALVALSSVVGRSCAIRPKRQDDWIVVPNLWGGVVGPPSSMKSPALGEALRPLFRLAREAADEHARRLVGHAAALADARARRKVVEEKMKKAARAGRDSSDLKSEHAQCADPPEPTERRYVVNDATVEKLGELLNQNPRGLLHYRDELAGWLATLDRDGHENDRAFFLESWNGAGRYTYDRIGRGTLHIDAACVSMLGGIQPGPLAAYLRAALRGGAGDDGLVQRFQLLVYPDPPKDWRNVDRWPDTAARNAAFDVFRRLDGLTPHLLAVDMADDGLPFLQFDEAAQPFTDEWRQALMKRLREPGEHSAIEAHLAKYPRLLSALALLFHLTDAPGLPPGPVGLTSVERAAAWCDLLEAHARRVYGTVAAQAQTSARALLAKLRAGALPAVFNARDVYRAGWAGLNHRQVVEVALELLEDHGWVRCERITDTGGRPRIDYTAHPSLRPREAA